jgi:signal transduction histidine kinase
MGWRRAFFILSKFGSLNFQISESKDAVYVKANKNTFARIISNLINNSIEVRHPDRSMQIILSVRCYSNQVIVSVQDNGVGISQENLGRIGKTGLSEGKSNGNGLGLHLAERSMAQWGGGVEALSQEGVGTIINLKFLYVLENV